MPLRSFAPFSFLPIDIKKEKVKSPTVLFLCEGRETGAPLPNAKGDDMTLTSTVTMHVMIEFTVLSTVMLA
jgi:hypothetical protein